MAMWTVKLEGVTYVGFGSAWFSRGQVVPPHDWPRLTAQLLAEFNAGTTSNYRELMDLSGFLIALGEGRQAAAVLAPLYARYPNPAVASKLSKATLLANRVNPSPDDLGRAPWSG